jgi:predicted Zn finger-like uncharacterized protein
MVQTWHKVPGDDFKCPHCGAVYEVTIYRFPAKDRDSVSCTVCEAEMVEWNDTVVPSFKLKKATDDA